MYRCLESLPWEPHPTFPGVFRKLMLTGGSHGAPLTCMLVKVPAGGGIPEHTHPESEDIILPLSGRAKMFVEGEGTHTLEPGAWVRVPKDTRHRIFEVEETVTLYDIFVPPIM